MNELKKLPQIIRQCRTIGEIPTSYKVSLTYEEQLMWFCRFLEEEVIPVVNNNSQVVQELKTYVEEYFKNLDVQEEINNKLDEMADDGTLEEIIASYLNAKAIFGFDNISNMKQAENLINGSFVKTYGKISYNDGLGQFYKIRTITNEDIIDEVTIIALLNETLVAELIPTNEINVKYFGAKGDNSTDDYNAINNAIIYAESKEINNFYIPKGIYLISNQLKMFTNMNIYGDGSSSILKATNFSNQNDYKSMIVLKSMTMDGQNNISNISIKNIAFDNNGLADAGKDGIIQFRGIRNAELSNIDMTVNGENCWGVILFSANHNVKIDHVKINNVSADNSMGGCIWVRSGLANSDNEDKKTKNIFITNSSFSSTAKDEVVCIADGVAGGWTETQLSNITIDAKATTTYCSYGLVVNAIGDNTSKVKVIADNLYIKGKFVQAGLLHGHNGINANCCEGNYNNIYIIVEAGNYGIRSYDKEQIFTNCNITVPHDKVTIQNATAVSCKLNGIISGSNVYDSIITSDTTGADNCKIVKNCIIKADLYGIKYYGGVEDISIQDNNIFADTYGIYSQVANNTGIKTAIISGNTIQRKVTTSNNGTIGINVQKTDLIQIVNNLIFGSVGNAVANIIGYQYGINSNNSTNTTSEINVIKALS